MVKRELHAYAIILCLIGLLGFSEPVVAGTIHIGTVNTEPVAEINKFLPLANYLAKQLQSEGIDNGRILVTKSISEMATALREDKVDLYIDSPFPILAVSRLAGSKLLLRRWKKGIGEYHTVIFSKADSSISQLEHLKGKTVAFEEPFSTSGYFLPKLTLSQKGFKLTIKKDPADAVAPGEVGYIFSYGDDNTMIWLLRGRIHAGAMDNDSYLKQAGNHISSLKIIHKTFSVPRQIVSYRTTLPHKLVARIRQILIAMDQSEEGKKVLQDFEKTTKFDEIPEESIAPLLQSQKFIDAEFGIK